MNANFKTLPETVSIEEYLNEPGNEQLKADVEAQAEWANQTIEDELHLTLAATWFVTGSNMRFGEGYRYRSRGIPSNVKESDLVEFARAVAAMARQKCHQQ